MILHALSNKWLKIGNEKHENNTQKMKLLAVFITVFTYETTKNSTESLKPTYEKTEISTERSADPQK